MDLFQTWLSWVNCMFTVHYRQHINEVACILWASDGSAVKQGHTFASWVLASTEMWQVMVTNTICFQIHKCSPEEEDSLGPR